MGTTTDRRKYAAALLGLGGSARFDAVRREAGWRVARSDNALIDLHQRGLVEVSGGGVSFTPAGRRTAQRWADELAWQAAGI